MKNDFEKQEKDGQTLNVVQEDVDIQKHAVERGRVRIHSRVEEVPYEESVQVREDVVSIERVPVGMEFDSPPEPRQEGDITILPVVEEIIVVTKRYRVVEEIRISRHHEIREEPVRTTVKRQRIDIETEGDVS